MARADRIEGSVPVGGAKSAGGMGDTKFSGPYAKDGTQIRFNSTKTKVVKIDPEGNVSSRPVSDKWKIVKGEVTVNGKTTVEKHAIPNRNSTQANHTVTRVDRKTGKSK